MHAINQGVREAEPPDAGKFLKNSSYKVLINSYFCGFRGGAGGGAKFLENFPFYY